MRKLGPLDELIKMLPGANKIKGLANIQVDEKQIARVEAIIRSMTKEEKTHPEIINASRKKRIAKGSGTTVQEVNRLLKQFDEMKKLMKMMTNMPKGKTKGFRFTIYVNEDLLKRKTRLQTVKRIVNILSCVNSIRRCVLTMAVKTRLNAWEKKNHSIASWLLIRARRATVVLSKRSARTIRSLSRRK